MALSDVTTPVRKVLDCCLVFPGLTINAGGAATFRTTSALTYTIGGLALTRAALSAQAFTAGHRPQVPVTIGTTTYGTTALYLVQVNAAGTIVTKQSNIAIAGVDADGRVGGVPMPAPWDQRAMLPESDDGFAPIGFLKITTNNATTFTPGTTALDATGITRVDGNLAFNPVNPFQ